MIKFDIPLFNRPRVIIAFGVFDGVHRGHRRIITELVKAARRHQALPVAVTFAPHPRTLFDPEHPVELLMPFAERQKLLHQLGAESVGSIEFNRDFANLSPEAFLQYLRHSAQFDLQGICVGKNWRFGQNGRGNREFLTAYCSQAQLFFQACPHYTVDHQVVSSTVIRQKIRQGELLLAQRMLGRPPQIFGTVGTGRQVATRILKTPTANLQVAAGILPPDGVYAAVAELPDGTYPAAVNVGYAPTFAAMGHERRVEAHLLDFSGNLYGQELKISFLNYLRPEKEFATPALLQAQITQDVNAIHHAIDAAGNQQ